MSNEIERCEHTMTDEHGIEGPCDRPATGWRWYQDAPHEDCLLPACSIHENVGGNRMHEAEEGLRIFRAETVRLQLMLDRFEGRRHAGTY